MLRSFLKRNLRKSFLKLSGDKEDGNYEKHLYALILAGGGGTRLWPRSRNSTPKQFLKLFQSKTLTQITVQRFSEIISWDNIYIVTVSDEYKSEILKEVPKLHPQNIIVEPERRETGPAHGLGATFIYKKDPDAVIITGYADALVKPIPRYLSTLKAAAKVAYQEKLLVTVGIEPRYPHTGYGHIKKGKLWSKVGGVAFYELEKFVEKPPLALAKKYTDSGNYYWNSGQFVWRADAILEAIAKYAPDIKAGLDKIWLKIGTSGQKAQIERVYKDMPKIAIDYAVAEKAKNFLVAEADFFWTDIGDWREVWENLPKDHMGNVTIDGDSPGGRVINIDTSDALIHTDGRLIAAVDVDNIVIIDTKDALLVCSKSRAQSVKKIVEELKNQKENELL